MGATFISCWLGKRESIWKIKRFDKRYSYRVAMLSRCSAPSSLLVFSLQFKEWMVLVQHLFPTNYCIVLTRGAGPCDETQNHHLNFSKTFFTILLQLFHIFPVFFVSFFLKVLNTRSLIPNFYAPLIMLSLYPGILDYCQCLYLAVALRHLLLFNPPNAENSEKYEWRRIRTKMKMKLKVPP